MNQFGVLYRYECKKLLGKKIVWISFFFGIVMIILSLLAPFFGDYYVDGAFMDTNYNMYQKDREYARKLDGRKIDQSLLEETIAAYRKIPQMPGKHYSATQEYQTYARPYSEIFGFVRNASGMQTAEVMLSWQPSEKDLYAKRQAWLMSLWEESGLSKGETDFWKNREAQIKTPYIYKEHMGYDTMISAYQTIGLFVLLFLAICLSGIFPDEHTRKTDQIVLGSPLGKTRLYWAKIAVGTTFAVISTGLLLAFAFVSTLCVYGAGGFGAAFQFLYTQNSDPVTCGQAVLIAYGNMVIAAAVISVFVMVLSELLQSSAATLAISTGLLFVSMMVDVPEQYRALSQIWNWLPWSYLAPWNVFGSYTVFVFGRYFAPWQAVPVLYCMAGVVIAAAGKPLYQHFQVCGR